MTEDYEDTLDDTPDLTDLEWLMIAYDKAPKASKSKNQPEMAYAWEIWLYCHDNSETVPAEIQERVDQYNRRIAMKQKPSIKYRDDMRKEQVKTDFRDLGIVSAIDELRDQGMSVEKACITLSAQWKKEPKSNPMARWSLGSDTLIKYYYEHRSKAVSFK